MNFRFAETTEEDVAVAADGEVFDDVAFWELVDLRDERGLWDYLAMHDLYRYQSNKG